MTYRSHGAPGRRDENEPEIIEALEDDGCLVKRIADPHIGDLLVFWGVVRHKYMTLERETIWEQGLIEVKMPKGRMRPKQQEWADLCAERGIRYAVVRSPEEAREAIARWRRGSR